MILLNLFLCVSIFRAVPAFAHHTTKNCIGNQTCKEYDIIIDNDFITSKSDNSTEKDIKGYYKKEIEKLKIDRRRKRMLRFGINAIFDVGVSVVIRKLMNNNGIFNVPPIKRKFSYLGINGDYSAVGASFEGLRNLKRTKDVIFSNDKYRYTISTEFNLAKTKVNIPSYKLKYIKEIDGHLKVNFEKLSVKTSVSLDYNKVPCKIHLNDLKIQDVGDVNVDFSGLGWPLNDAGKEVIRYTLRNDVFDISKKIIAEETSNLNCEKYRPDFKIQDDGPF